MSRDPSQNLWVGAGLAIFGFLIALSPVLIHGANADFSRIQQGINYGGTAIFILGVWICLIRSYDQERDDVNTY